MSNYAQEALKNADTTHAIIDILQVINEKSNYGDNIKKISETEKTIYLVGEIEAEVNNGGFSQYFFNSSGKNANKAVKALENIGARHTAELLKEAISVCKKSDTDELSDEQEEKLNELDDKFYKYEDDLAKLQIEFIKANLNDFN